MMIKDIYEEMRVANCDRFHELEDEITSKGRVFNTAFLMYMDARDNGNENPDIRQNWMVDTSDVGDLVKTLRDNHFSAFTISNKSTGTNEIIWEALKHGCKLDGMTEVKIWGGVKTPAFLITL